VRLLKNFFLWFAFLCYAGISASRYPLTRIFYICSPFAPPAGVIEMPISSGTLVSAVPL
jgi:hypothetical protein